MIYAILDDNLIVQRVISTATAPEGKWVVVDRVDPWFLGRKYNKETKEFDLVESNLGDDSSGGEEKEEVLPRG